MSVASAVRASISTGPSGRPGCSATTMRAGASSSVMSSPLRSLNRTVFWPTGSSSWSRVAGAAGSPEPVLPCVERDVYAAAPECRCQTCVRLTRKRVRVSIFFSIAARRGAQLTSLAGGLRKDADMAVPQEPRACANAAQAAEWDGPAGAHRIKHAAVFDAEARPHNERFRAATGVAPADHVLDVGCGTGQSTRDAARAAVAGRVLGIDLSAAMRGR